MAQLTKTQLLALYGLLGITFPDNTTQEISEADMRQFGQDLADSLVFNLSDTVESWKSPCRVGTTANITLSGEQTIDTVAAVSGDRVLVLNQTTATQNGIYVVAVGAWSRSTDADSGAELEGAAVAVQEGATYFNKIFIQTTDSVTIGVSNIVWVVFGTSSGISGLTTNRVPYATSATTLGDEAAFTWDPTNDSLTIASLRIHTKAGPTNVFIGASAGNFTLTGLRNISLGNQALLALTNGTDNVALGYFALYQNTGGVANIAIGSTALGGMLTGQANIGIGANALLSNAAGLSNIALGSAALSQATGDRNISLGENAGDNITSGSRNVVIGYNIDAQGATVSDQLTIQNIIFGLSNSGSGTTPSTGFIGIGEPAPTRKLEVAGSLAIKAGTSTGQIARVGGVLNTNTTTTGNTLVGEDTLFSYTVPANTLATNGDTITATFAGTIASSVNDKRIRIKFGATTIFDVTDSSTNAGSWCFTVTIIRTGATTQKAIVGGIGSTGSSTHTSLYTTPGQTLSGTVNLVVTGEATLTNEVVFEMGKVRWEPAE